MTALTLAPKGARSSALPLEPAAEFDLAGLSCRVVCVDGRVPAQQPGHSAARTRMTYLPGEVAHFHLGGHCWALVAEAPGRVEAGGTCGAAQGLEDIRSRLSNRELQIVQLICMGLLTKQVADRLHISEFTVRSYLKTIYCKLGVRSRGAMVYAYAQALSRSPRPVDEPIGGLSGVA